MRLTEEQAAVVALRCINQGGDYNAGDYLERALGRILGEDEAKELQALLVKTITDGLSEFEFGDEEESPNVNFHQTWADNHHGVGYRRPKGRVIYTVTGEIAIHRHGLIRGVSGVLVERSSDGKEVPMTIKELEAMVELESGCKACRDGGSRHADGCADS